MRSTPRHAGGPTPGRVLTATLSLRFAEHRVTGRVYWAPEEDAGAAGSPLVFVAIAPDGSDCDSLCRLTCSTARAVVLAVPIPQAPQHDDDLAALGWAAEHAAQLGAHLERLIVMGEGAGGAAAARLSLRARDNGWPQLRRQVVVYPSFTQACPMPSLLTGVAPATVISTDIRVDDGRRYAAQLRASHVEVDELRYPTPILPGHDDLCAASSGRDG